MECLDNRRAARSLGRVNFWELSAGEAYLAELAKSPPDPGEQRAARDRRDHVLGEAPPELLNDLKRQRLGPLRVVAPEIDVGGIPIRSDRPLAYTIG